jgi:hypothetical protein
LRREPSSGCTASVSTSSRRICRPRCHRCARASSAARWCVWALTGLGVQHVQLVMSDWDGNNQWLPGVKTMLQMLQQG